MFLRYELSGRCISLNRLLFFLICASFLIACNRQNPENADHTEYVEKISSGVDSLLNSGNMEKAQSYLDSSYSLLIQPGNRDLWVRYNHKVNFYTFYEKNTKKAKKYLDSMFLVLEDRSLKYPLEYANTLFAKGDLDMADKQYTQAYASYFRGSQFVQEHLDSCEYGRFSSKLALVKYKQGRYMQAVTHLKQALSEYSHCRPGGNKDFNNRFLFPQSDLNTIALCFERSDQIDSAIYYYKKAILFIKRTLLKFPHKKQFAESALGVVYGNLGGTYVKAGNFELAEYYLKADILLNDREAYALEDAQTAKLKLVALYLANARYPQANELLKQIEDDLSSRRGKSVYNDEIKLRYQKMKWEYYEKIGDLAGAHRYSLNYYHFRDSLDLLNKGLKEADFDAGIKDAGQRYQITLLRKDNQLKTTYFAGAVIFSMLAIVILSLLVMNLRRSKRNVRELVGLNRQIEEKNLHTQETLSALEQSHAENTRIMKMVAHDLRNPVGGITALTDMMLSESHYSKEDREMLEMIHASGQSSLDLINDLLQYTVQQELKKDPVDLYELLSYCTDMLQLKASEKGQCIDLEAAHLIIPINREKIWRVFSNLISNAIKFSPNGSRITVNMKPAPDAVTISVSDQGIGIPPEMKDKIFDMFTEAKRIGTKGEQPFGMGLAIAKQIVEAHGGIIWCESVPGIGTTFYVELPSKSDIA